MEDEYLFHPFRKWRFDRANVQKLIAIEIEGGTWIEGRHNRGAGFTEDCEKYNDALALGWRVIRVTHQMVKNGKAVQWYQSLVKLMELTKNGELPSPMIMDLATPIPSQDIVDLKKRIIPSASGSRQSGPQPLEPQPQQPEGGAKELLEGDLCRDPIQVLDFLQQKLRQSR